MTMTKEEYWFLIICIGSLAVSVVYLLVGILIVVPVRIRKERRKKIEVQHDNRRAFLTRFIVMALCPVVGPLFYFFSYLFYHLFFWTKADLADVIFSKERVKTQLKADEERERDMVPLEEALSVNEKKDLRMVMLNTIRGGVQDSLASIMLALNSGDSESSHYAASVLSSELDEFRSNVQRLCKSMQEEQSGQTEYEEMLLDYMNGVLQQRLFTNVEQEKLVRTMEEAAQSLYGKNPQRLTEQRYEGVCLRLLEIKDYPNAQAWAQRLAEQHPNCLAAYTCRLKLYFTLQDREAFFDTMAALKRSDVVIDRETLEMIRVFS